MSFWIAGILLLVLVVPFIVFPWLRKEQGQSAHISADNAQEANLSVYRQQEKQYREQLETGEISQDEFEALRTEAQQLLLANTNTVADKKTTEITPQSKGFWLAPLLVLSIMVASLLMYQQRGAKADQQIADLLAQRNRLSAEGKADSGLEKKLYRAIEQRVQQRPDNLYYLGLMAQYRLAMRDYAGAETWLQKALSIAPEDSYLLGEYAQVLFFAAANQITGKVRTAIEKAYAADANNTTVLGLKGIDAYQQQNFKQAVIFWQKALRQIPPGSPEFAALRSGIERARQALGEDVVGRSVKIWVDVADQVTYTPDQTVFVAVLENQGSAMPVAAIRLVASQLSEAIVLTDNEAMIPGRDLSSIQGELVAVARISNTGTATPQAGDWEGRSAPFKLGDDQVKVKIRIDHWR